MKSRIYILDLELKLRSLTTILLTCSHESLWIEWDIILYIWDNLTSSN